ncbi:probable G-protein coupled receptor 141 isoform X2 [Camelus ferus]|uniref:Probable G-protein coupled receptor 141 isoform X2 n=1 Tax=Camelus ferus TaxID=419612 RepID=A0A8B8TBH5_CAMFR|nr:probable G-protein coupled receptor 141 isoform X2 [Camelus ferus]
MQPVPVLFKAEIKHFNSKSSCQERKDNCWKVAGETPQIPTLALLEEAKAVAMHSLQIGKGDSTHVFSPRVFCCFCCRLSPYHPGNHSTRYSLLSTAQCRISSRMDRSSWDGHLSLQSWPSDLSHVSVLLEELPISGTAPVSLAPSA